MSFQLFIIASSLITIANCVVWYIVGVKQGKKYERRVVTLDFQQIIHKLLHFAAKQDYRSLHLMLIELCDDEPSDRVSEFLSSAEQSTDSDAELAMNEANQGEKISTD